MFWPYRTLHRPHPPSPQEIPIPSVWEHGYFLELHIACNMHMQNVLFLFCRKIHYQGLYPFSEKNFQDFSRTFAGLRSIDFSRALKVTLTPTLPRSWCWFSLLSSRHYLFFLSWANRFPELSRTSGIFPGLSIIKFQDFPGFPGSVQTLIIQLTLECKHLPNLATQSPNEIIALLYLMVI